MGLFLKTLYRRSFGRGLKLNPYIKLCWPKTLNFFHIYSQVSFERQYFIFLSLKFPSLKFVFKKPWVVVTTTILVGMLNVCKSYVEQEIYSKLRGHHNLFESLLWDSKRGFRTTTPILFFGGALQHLILLLDTALGQRCSKKAYINSSHHIGERKKVSKL